jgi:hypothetical protein
MQARTIRRRLVTAAVVTLLGILALSNIGLAQTDAGYGCEAPPDVIVRSMDRADAVAWLQACSGEANTVVALRVAADRADVIEQFRGAAGSG